VDDLRFKIDAWRPDTIPMARLAEYMAELAALLGNEKAVHFVRLDQGSVQLVHRVDVEDQPKVEARLEAMRLGEGPSDATRAFRRIDGMLADDNATGTLAYDQDAVVIEFPGKNRPKPIDYGSVTQASSVDGVPIKVGGRKDSVAVHLQAPGLAGREYHCKASRSMARAIAAHLFEATIRVRGPATWHREGDGTWTLKELTIKDFEVLDGTPMADVVEQLRAVTGNGWRKVADPLATLAAIRGDEDSAH